MPYQFFNRPMTPPVSSVSKAAERYNRTKTVVSPSKFLNKSFCTFSNAVLVECMGKLIDNDLEGRLTLGESEYVLQYFSQQFRYKIQI